MFVNIIIYRDVILYGWPYICKTNCKMFDTAKVMVGQRVIQCTHVGSYKKGSAVPLISKIKSQNLVLLIYIKAV